MRNKHKNPISERYKWPFYILSKILKACVYVNKLEDIDLEILKELIRQSVDFMRTHQFDFEVKVKVKE